MTDMKQAAVIGFPITQSLSPLIHQYWMKKAGLNAGYRPREIAPAELPQQVDILRGELVGWNVTVPHKESIMPLLDKVAPLARTIGAVNTVVVKDGLLTGYNTDISGFKKQLDKTVANWPKDKPPLIIGAGGAARAAVAAFLASEVPFVMITNRTKAKADVLAKELGRGRVTVVDWDDRQSAVVAAGVIVNTTTLGMVGQGELSLDLSSAGPDCVVYDIVYKPLKTKLLEQAEDRGLRTVDGLGMLVYQAADAFKIWFDLDVHYDDELRTQLLEALA